MAISVQGHCLFARGEHHLFTLSDDGDSVEVEGRICWTQSEWELPLQGSRSSYFQIAGVSFVSVLTERPQGLLSSLWASAFPLSRNPLSYISTKPLIDAPLSEA